MTPTPILFLSDSPDRPSGLGRITRDLATHCATLPNFRVGTLGLGGRGSAHLPFAQYTIAPSTQARYGEDIIAEVWDDFAGSERGIIMTVWDISRLTWFANPRGLEGTPLHEFLAGGRFQKWAYVPIDAYGVGGRLTGRYADALQGFDRVLAYTLYGKTIIEDTLGREVDWLPHGFHASEFAPRPPANGRKLLGVDEGAPLLGMVATNQFRKDWGTAMAVAATLRSEIPNLRFWAHVDVEEFYWSIPGLVEDFRLNDCVVVTRQGMFTSEELSYLYSACDATFLPAPEGFGYPIIESLACGAPVVHGNFGGGAELVPDRSWLVEPAATRIDGRWNNVRPVWEPHGWAAAIKRLLAEPPPVEFCTSAVAHLNWKLLWPVWKKWFLAGLEDRQ